MHKLNVVIVEDERTVARDLQRLLERLGHSVSACAGSAEEALRQIAQARPDLVLMDIHLQGPTDGIALSGDIRKRYNLPVIYLIACADEETTARALRTEPIGYIVRPFEPIEVRLAIDMALARIDLERQLQPQTGRAQIRPQQWQPAAARGASPNHPHAGERPVWAYAQGRAIPLDPESVWQVRGGLVKLSTVHPSGEEALVGLAGPGRVFGSCLTSLTPYQATTLSRVQLVRFDLRELSISTALIAALQPYIQRGIRQTEALLSIFGQKLAADRLRGLLLLLGEEIGQPVKEGVLLDLPISHQELASAIGVERATVTMSLGSFRREGLISLRPIRRLLLGKRLLDVGAASLN